ncbi:hypothetical protein [Nocardia aurea]|uniref:CopG family transcriptional regulator n=1 Tax=Nocardia aurea TaxID=2144174 RepID=A0ABV3G5E4_9NOCA
MSDEAINDTARQTPGHQVRVPKGMWQAWGRVTARQGLTRTDRVLDTLRADIEAHGGDDDRAALAAGDAELAERRARLSPGRPRRSGR